MEPIKEESEETRQSDHEIEDEYLVIKNIIDEVITEVERLVNIKAIYQQKAVVNNQYKLFNLSDYITEFKVDETIFSYLPFREILLISKLETIGSDSPDRRTHRAPTPIGGLCLDVQSVPGRRPSSRFDLTPGQVQRDVAERLEKIHEVLHMRTPTPPIPSEELDDYVQNEVRMYEEDLRREMETDKNKFLVHVSSELDYDGRNGGSRITAWVDRHFHTLEEKRTEYIAGSGSTTNEKQIHIVMKKDHYFVTVKDTEQRQVTRKSYTFTETAKMVGEGANFLLMRYLALNRFIGTFELSTVHINGDLCRNIYECLGPDSGIFNGTKLDICKIYRTVIEECGIEDRSVTVLTLQGQILKQEMMGTSVLLQVNPLARLANERPPDTEPTILTNAWEKDMQLVSMFLDSKTDCRMHMAGYLRDHPEVMEMISDYVQTVLQIEPDNVLDFTVDYFRSFAPLDLARTEHFEPTRSSDHHLFI